MKIEPTTPYIITAMPYQHTNRRGDVYHIQSAERNGKIAYSATTKPTGKPVDRLPDGYEIYEEPESAQVFVRKIKPTRILPAEKQMVEAAVRRLAKVTHFIVKAEAKTLVVYLSDAHEDAALNILRGFAPMTGEESRSMTDYMLKHAKYVKMMRFSLVDEKDRLFSADRWCFRGSVDNWHRLEWRDSLEALVEKFVPHLGRESFYDLI